MQLITNRIQTGSGGSFSDFVEKYKREHNIKTASAEDDNVKTAAEQEEADSSGQLDVEPLHQEGESTTMPKAGPSAKKEGKDGKGASASATDTDPEKEGKDSGQPKAEGSEKFTNKVKFDPNDNSDEEKGIVDAGSKTEAKVASDTCDKCDCDPCECKEASTKVASDTCDKCDCDPCKCKEASTKEAGHLPDALKDHQFKSKNDKDEDENKDEDKEDKEAKVEDEDETTEASKEKDEEKESKVDDKKEETKEATVKVEFVKLANLDSKNKKYLTDYWRQLFGDDYVKALVADK